LELTIHFESKVTKPYTQKRRKFYDKISIIEEQAVVAMNLIYTNHKKLT
jgi:hypothetical protein